MSEQDHNKTSLLSSPHIRKACISEFLKGNCMLASNDINALGLAADMYMLVSINNKNSSNRQFNYPEILRLTGQKDKNYDIIDIDDHSVILFKGSHAVKSFESLISRYDSNMPPEKNSPLDSLFFVCSDTVNDISLLPECYITLCRLLKAAFFVSRNIHVLKSDTIMGDTDFAGEQLSYDTLHRIILSEYSNYFINQIQVYNRNKINEKLLEMHRFFNESSCSVDEIKSIITDLYINIFMQLMLKFNTSSPAFSLDSESIYYIRNSSFLYEVTDFISARFDLVMTATGHSSRDSIIEDVIYYIEHNYSQNLTLESIAPIFGYNSSYLGKIFHRKTGMRLSAYLDTVRIEHAKNILESSKFQVYRVAEMVGYRNVDYFHIKFKKHTGMSPLDYRKTTGQI